MLSEFEKCVLGMLLDGDDHRLSVLRAQLNSATVTERIYSESGFYTNFSVPASSPRLSSGSKLIIDDVHAEIRELKYPIMCILWVRDGALDFLECVAIGDDPWPQVTTLQRTYYLGPIAPGTPQAAETNKRDIRWALGDLKTSSYHVSGKK